ncbi:hypothetical protein [Rhizobium rhizogenes]|uniref:Uncharacterized protein n=1 Tax=Rhizobium rhizogenes (strain K84 / ATCC BAA-868) TaxID=311403 RepID=B9JNZ0_RHIR8|nr:hypothetical protein Arad_7859 [Rhizobium rhizogenes K84]
MSSVDAIIEEVLNTRPNQVHNSSYKALRSSNSANEYSQEAELANHERLWFNDLYGFVDHYRQGESERGRLIQKVRLERDPDFGNLLLESSFDAYLLGETVQFPYSIYFNMARNVRSRLLLNQVKDDTTAIIELGAGTGMALIDLWHSGIDRQIPLICMEPTHFGRLCFDFLTRLEPKILGRSIYFNFQDPVFPEINDLNTQSLLLFTSGAIEYIEELPEQLLLDIICRFDKVCGVHLEPLGWQIPDLKITTSSPQSLVRSGERGQNKNLWQLLVKLQNSGLIRISSEKEFGVYGSLKYPITYLRWDKL